MTVMSMACCATGPPAHHKAHHRKAVVKPRATTHVEQPQPAPTVIPPAVDPPPPDTVFPPSQPLPEPLKSETEEQQFKEGKLQ